MLPMRRYAEYLKTFSKHKGIYNAGGGSRDSFPIKSYFGTWICKSGSVCGIAEKSKRNYAKQVIPRIGLSCNIKLPENIIESTFTRYDSRGTKSRINSAIAGVFTAVWNSIGFSYHKNSRKYTLLNIIIHIFVYKRIIVFPDLGSKIPL